MGDAYSSLHGFVVTPLVTTPFSLNLCTMRDTNSSLHDLVVTSIKATPFSLPLSAMRDTNTSLLCILGASLDFASGLIRFLFVVAIEEL